MFIPKEHPVEPVPTIHLAKAITSLQLAKEPTDDLERLTCLATGLLRQSANGDFHRWWPESWEFSADWATGPAQDLPLRALTSFDQALELLAFRLPDYLWEMKSIDHGRYEAMISEGRGRLGYTGTGATPQIALCMAILMGLVMTGQVIAEEAA